MKVMRLFLDKYLFKTVIDIARSLIVVVIDLLIVTLCIQYFYAALGFAEPHRPHSNTPSSPRIFSTSPQTSKDKAIKMSLKHQKGFI